MRVEGKADRTLVLYGQSDDLYPLRSHSKRYLVLCEHFAARNYPGPVNDDELRNGIHSVYTARKRQHVGCGVVLGGLAQGCRLGRTVWPVCALGAGRWRGGGADSAGGVDGAESPVVVGY